MEKQNIRADMSSAAHGPYKANSKQDSGRTASDIVGELAQLVRDLHQSLEIYAPVWYTRKMDDRVKKELAEADSILRSSADRQQLR
jgi:hypothetical protein